ncbi:TPA: RES family NAD+ phosphorylase [Yersinia enterocolitica]|uniref:RES family NAD+ phosphorylase n=1 Tax=Yersinia enterocolitica TaxID=630 RepID=UPI001C8DE35F|nr:RES family NAD+ phosphorylase [Yersinia enterocolitica]EKN4086849.1 RES family NAD+ phosphorylase [Yersinia enterocolitica]EKN6387032.1 hypothetical protein [Yersinia enterocolitica]MBX9488092.1 RES family NAD+ phosphorylase [Yersinia enterocolitica]MBX9491530.1 RES family NAD+ phosphorylase [Yersinia enterocolitica]MBX9498313.1 RES family NAD+ phosphorylase [Yersinia enterocolitica]
MLNKPMEMQLRNDLEKLVEENAIPTIVINANTDYFRFQTESHNGNAVYFNSNTEKLGRFSLPSGTLGTYYIASTPTTALAESFGRLRSMSPSGEVFIGEADLATWYLPTVTSLKTITVVDFGMLMFRLGLTLDVVTGEDYKITQFIAEFLATLPGCPYQGLAYSSRHLSSQCFAIWAKTGNTRFFQTKAMPTVKDFRHHSDFPADWKYADISGQEILTKVLKLVVSGYSGI